RRGPRDHAGPARLGPRRRRQPGPAQRRRRQPPGHRALRVAWFRTLRRAATHAAAPRQDRARRPGDGPATRRTPDGLSPRHASSRPAAGTLSAMSENPYAAYPSNHASDARYDGQQRLSIPAVRSLVSSIVCCIPGMGLLALLLGLLGMLTI